MKSYSFYFSANVGRFRVRWPVRYAEDDDEESRPGKPVSQFAETL